MALKLTSLLLLTHVTLALTSPGDTRTFNVTSLDGTVRQLQYPWQQYSECLFRGPHDVLYCNDDYSYREIVPIWKNQPEQIKYVKVNCLTTKQRRQGTCYCKNRGSISNDGSQDEKYFVCQIRKLEEGVFNKTESIEVLDLSDNVISEMDRNTLAGLTNLRYCSLDNNNFLDIPDKLFCSTPDIEFVSMNLLSLEHFPSHSFRCQPALTKLTVLQMRESHLKDVPRDSLDYLPALESLDLGGNNLGSIYKQSFAGAAALKHLNLSDNDLRELFPHFCNYMGALTHLHLKSNIIYNLTLDELDDCNALEDLDLSQNELRNLTGNIASLTSLQKLNVSGNTMSFVDVTFPTNSRLSHFDISHNQIVALPEALFANTKALTFLNVSNNLLKEAEKLPTLFASLVNLETLDLSHNKLLSVYNSSFSSMPQLKRLLLGANMLADISEDAFKGLGALETLTLDHNALTQLAPNVFKPLSSLTYLSLSNNHLASLDIYSWPYLSELYVDHNKLESIPSTIHFSDLDVLDVSNNKLTSFVASNENLYVNFGKMRSLDISHNRISDMSPRVFNTMRSIESLSLHHNQIQLNLSQSLLMSTPNLTYLNLAYNGIRDLDNMFSQNSIESVVTLNLSGNPLQVGEQLTSLTNTSLQTLDMSSCNISGLNKNFFWNLRELTHAHLEGNKLETFPTFRANSRTTFYLIDNPLICACNMSWLADFTAANYRLPKCSVYTETGLFNPSQLERRQYMCPETTGCHSACACYKTTQTGPIVTTVCRNNLKTVPATIPNTTVAIFLDGNDFADENSLAPFVTMSKLSAKELYLNKCAIASLDKRTFQAFDALEILSLENNVIEYLPSGIFSNKLSLKQLYMKTNMIRYFEKDTFKNLPKLDELDISNNKLALLSADTLSELSELNARYFFLADNHWACNCSNRGFKTFVDKIRTKIRDRNSLFCDSSNHEILQLSLSSFTCAVKAESLDSGKPVTIIGIIIAILIVFVLLAVFVYFRRELLALLYYRTGCRIPSRPKLHPGKHFDVYISYDQQDQHCCTYVTNTLLPKLRNNGFNFQTSSDLIEDAEVIQKVIEDSKSSIFIVNKNFSSNPFQLRVFQAASYIQRRDKLHKVVLIIHGDIDLSVMEAEVMKHLRRGDYVTSRSRLWWERLIYELPLPCGLANTAENDDVSESDVIVFSSLTRDQYDTMT